MHPKRGKVPKLFAIATGLQIISAGQNWLDALSRAGAALWLRDKGLGDRELLALGQEVRRKFAGVLTISARFDLAQIVGADGVHLPAQGLPSKVVRQAWPDGLIGRSTHSLEELPQGDMNSLVVGCDYVTLSPIFESPSKPGVAGVGTSALSTAVMLEGKGGVKIIALGGIDSDTAGLAFESGAHGVAAIRGLQSLSSIRRISSLAS